MSIRRSLWFRVGRLFIATLGLFACETVFILSAQAQQPAPTPYRPIRIDDTPRVGEPRRVELDEGKYKLIYQNRKGQDVREQEFVLGILIKEKSIFQVYANGQVHSELTTYFDASGNPTRREDYRYDSNGTARERVITRLYPIRAVREKWDPETKSWIPIPHNQILSGKAWGDYVEMKDFIFNPNTGEFEPTSPKPSDSNNSRTEDGEKQLGALKTSKTNFSASASRGFAVASELTGGLNTTTFDTPDGKIYVNLPDDLSAGDTLSGTVVGEPQGQDEKTRTKNQGELSGYVVEIAKQQSSSTNRVLKLSIPAAISTTHLVLRDKKGKEVARCEVPIDRQPKTSPSTGQEFGLPTMGQQGSPMEVIGAFDGDFTTTNLTVAGERMEILAESPRKLVVRNSSHKVGPTQLAVSEQGRTATGEFRSLDIKLSAPKLDLVRGEQTTLTVTVLGLEGIKAPVPLVLENKSPGIISMGSTNLERISISPSQVQAGTYTTERSLTGIQRGSFTITGTVTRDQ